MLSFVLSDVDSPCSEFDHGSPLHIAAANLAVDSAKELLLHGANPHAKDDLGRSPLGKLLAWFGNEILAYNIYVKHRSYLQLLLDQCWRTFVWKMIMIMAWWKV